MRWLCLIPVSLFFTLTSCATRVGDVPAYGPVWLVSRDDIRNAVAADRAAPRKNHEESIDHVEIVGHNTIWVRHEPNNSGYCEVRRVADGWRYIQSWFYVD